MIITLADGTLARLPAWMASAERCAHLTLAQTPRCSVDALRGLRMLIDSWRRTVGSLPEASGHTDTQEDTHETHTPKPFPVRRPSSRVGRLADVTYVRTGNGWLYLAVVLDAFSRRVVGWAMSPVLEIMLVLDALNMAPWNRRPTPGVVHHSSVHLRRGAGG